MYREIKFRYWDPTYHDAVNGEMIYSHKFQMLSDFFEEHDKAPYGGNNPSLMQYSGLKDAKGREIYEDDIVRGSWSDKINSMVVKFQSPSFVMMINEEKWSEFNIVGNQPYVVIGNIYETAEKGQS